MTPAKSNIPKAPKKLTAESRKLWASVTGEFHLEAHHIELLAQACCQLDRCLAAKKLIEKDGLTITDRFGQLREHPGISIERNAALSFLKLARELGLDVEPATAQRGPRRPGTRS